MATSLLFRTLVNNKFIKKLWVAFDNDSRGEYRIKVQYDLTMTREKQRKLRCDLTRTLKKK